MESVKYFVLMALNSLNRVRDAVYLDTNAWSMLAKGEVSAAPLLNWTEANGCFLWIARMQIAELAARRDIVRGLASLLEHVGVVLLDRDQNEFTGAPWYRVPVTLQQYLRLSTPELKNEFLEQFTTVLEPARQQIKRDRDVFKSWLEHALASIPHDDSRNWLTFPRRLESWIRYVCASNGHGVVETSISDPDCYVGLRLSYAVLFIRYIVNRQPWQEGDFLDYLHAADMAYARVVVTERNLAECIRQATRRSEITGPELAVDISWLRNPR